MYRIRDFRKYVSSTGIYVMFFALKKMVNYTEVSAKST